jgi:4-diphosphocytidyl-2-C-methyl-D-erythritol kinase
LRSVQTAAFTPSSFAPAKVNLYLHVTGRRADGYHLLDSLCVFPAIGDRLSYQADEALSLTLSGAFGGALAGESDNLVLRAARRLAAKAGLHASGRLLLDKALPVASGIGGGSADAAAALRLLRHVWSVDVDLMELAPSLGADVPICLTRQSARMGGIGEVLSPSPRLPCFGLVLVNPGVPVATASVFGRRSGAYSPVATLPQAWPDVHAMAADLKALRNDLQDAAVVQAPGIADVLTALSGLSGTLLARMSGSGATCFAICETAAAAREAAATLHRPDWWVWGGGLYETSAGDL